MSRFIFLLSTLCFFSQQLTGQENIPSDTISLETVTVTHSKIPIPTRETIKPVQIINQQEIQQNLGKDLSQLLNEQSGVLINGAFSNPGKDKAIFINGAASEFALVLIDGQPILDPSGIGISFDLRLMPLSQIERIEIMKGSQSTLYGSSAIGGVINVITKKTSQGDPFQLNGNLSYGSLNTLNGNAGINGQSGIFDYNVSVTRYQTDGITEAIDNDPSVEFDKDGSEVWNTQANLGFQLTDNVKLQPFFRYTDFQGDFDDGSFSDAENAFDSELINTGTNIQYQAKKLQANLNYSYTDTKRTFSSSFGVSNFEGQLHNIDLWGSYSLNQELQLLGGFNFQNHQMIDATAVEIDPSFQIASPYLHLIGNYAPFHFELGYRYNNHSEFGGNSNFSIASSYWVSSQTKLFGNYTTGFKAPDLFQLFGSFGANPNLDPQTSQSTEFGIQQSWDQSKWNAQLSYFNRQVDDLIAFTFDPGYINQNEQNDQGVNFEIKWTPSNELFIKANYTYLTGEITTPSAGRDTTFNNLIRRPEHQVGLAIGYQPSKQFSFNLQTQYLGDRNDLFFNPANGFAAENVNLDSYFIANFYAEYRLPSNNLAFYADLKNITDSDFVESYGFNTLSFNAQFGIRFQL